jgi:hypothetical protein
VLQCAVIGAVYLFPHCTRNVAGGGTEDVNTRIVMGKIYLAGNQPASHALVRLIPDGYDPVTGGPLGDSLTDTTGDGGDYLLKAAGPGVYNIVAVDIVQRTRLLISGLTVQDHITNAPPGSLTNPGIIKAFLPDSIDTLNGYVYVPGTDIAAFPGSGKGFFIIDSVPAGLIPVLEYAVKNTATRNAVRYGIQVTSGDTCVILMPAWKFAQRLYLNTTASGADVPGNVTVFPALVRLTNSNFFFARAKGDGSDLRFTKSDGTPLSYEIERWDSANGRAEIWVKIDTVYGNSSSQYVEMYWGNAIVTSGSNGAAVFDTVNGFQGVWHMAQGGGATARDATINGYHGTPTGATKPIDTTGPVGRAKWFDGSTSCFVMANTASSKLNFPQNGTYTLSAWANPTSLGGQFKYNDICNKSDLQYNLCLSDNSPIPPNPWSMTEYNGGWQSTNSTVTAVINQWTYVTGIRDGTNQSIYVNGDFSSSAISTAGGGSRDETRNVGIGALTNTVVNDWFSGSIDEVRIENKVRSSDWIKLCYMNQKTTDALVVTGP